MFEGALAPLSTKTIVVTIGFQSGNSVASVMWLQSLDIWAYFGHPPEGKSPGKRYWNAFGIGEPKGMVDIVCEVNPPFEGINRKVGGAFVQGETGEIYLVQRGLLNAGGRMKKDFVFEQFSNKVISVRDGKRISKVILIGELSATDFPSRFRNFVSSVKRIKNIYRLQ